MNIFSKVPVPKAHFSNFNMSHEYHTSMDMADLVPIQCLEILPNDTVTTEAECFVRLAPMMFPIMHRVNMKVYHFFVSNLTIWKYWEKFISERPDDNLPSKPYIRPSTFQAFGSDPEIKNLYSIGSLMDYMGIPVSNGASDETLLRTDEKIDIMPFMAYQFIYNEYFRDENLMPDLFDEDTPLEEGNLTVIRDGEGYLPSLIPDASGVQNVVLKNLFALRKKCWEKDYFTSALPENSMPETRVPLTGSLSMDEQDVLIRTLAPNFKGKPVTDPTGWDADQYSTRWLQNQPTDPVFDLGMTTTLGTVESLVDITQRSKMTGNVPVKGTVGFSLNDLRLAASIQRFKELLMRAGHRYKETIYSMFNQVTPDYRLDRPEFLGSTTIPLQVGEVPNMTGTENAAQGQLAGKGTIYGSDNKVRYHAYAHGFLISIACVLPRTAYQNGLERKWSRFDRYDYYFPSFEHLGEQAIKNKEIFLGSNEEYNNETFGYTPRYAEYKYVPSSVHGDMRGKQSLDFMTLARDFTKTPKLNADFVTVDKETCNKAFAITGDTEQHLYCDFYLNTKMRRPMQKFPLPKLV